MTSAFRISLVLDRRNAGSPFHRPGARPGHDGRRVRGKDIQPCPATT